VTPPKLIGLSKLEARSTRIIHSNLETFFGLKVLVNIRTFDCHGLRLQQVKELLNKLLKHNCFFVTSVARGLEPASQGAYMSALAEQSIPDSFLIVIPQFRNLW
jgi:hypothetical protein